MTETKTVELKTLSFMKGPFHLVSYEPEMRDSAYEGRERYEAGMLLTLSNPRGDQYRVLLPKGGKQISLAVVYHKFVAMMLDNPDINLLNISYDINKGDYIISGKIGTIQGS